ncbi:MAG: site-specific integrase, partial [Chloroflexi bacterium]|nr:site-specific integrase [Chloroflexota bacterium]
IHELDSGTYIAPNKTTVAQYLRHWLLECGKPSLTPRSYERYKGIVEKNLIPAIGRIRLVELRPEHIQRHYSNLIDRGLAARTVRYDHIVLHSALRMAVKWQLVPRNVADAVEPPKPKQSEMQTWDSDEVAQFLEAAKKTPHYVLFYTALYTGARRSELLGLSWRHIDFLYSQMNIERGLHWTKGEGYMFTQPKTARSRRTIALSPSLTLLLREHKEKQGCAYLLAGKPLTDGDLVFSHPDGSPLFPNSVSRAWVTLARKAGVKVIRFHDARHSHATLLLRQGAHPRVVQERLGHSTIATTLDVYSHVTPGLQEAVAARFDEAMSNRYNNHIKSDLKLARN